MQRCLLRGTEILKRESFTSSLQRFSGCSFKNHIVETAVSRLRAFSRYVQGQLPPVQEDWETLRSSHQLHNLTYLIDKTEAGV